jgi:hypothetical protein
MANIKEAIEGLIVRKEQGLPLVMESGTEVAVWLNAPTARL